MKTVYYFAYGSNMNSRYLSNNRRITPRQSYAATVEDHKVHFAQSNKHLFLLSIIEPAFAQLVKSVGEIAHGVVHQLTERDINRIDGSEGPQYRWEEIEAVLSDGKKVVCKTLICSNQFKSAPPSRRYLNLCLEGAVENALPEVYLEKLRNTNTVYYRGFSEAAEKAINTVVKLRTYDVHSFFKRVN